MKRLKDILDRIVQLKSMIDDHGQLDADLKKRINYKFRLDWNYFSNAMEGNSLTRIETKQLMMDNVTISGKPFKDITEMRGHDEQVLDILKIGEGHTRISENRIKEMHRAIMHEDDQEKRSMIGAWKTTNNHVLKGNRGERIDFLPFEEVPGAIHDLLNRTNADIDALENPKKENKSPVLIAFEFHLEYLTIHPFFDGNGRTGRLLMNLLLIRFGYQPIILSEKSRDLYYKLLAQVQGAGADPKDFYSFLGELLIESQQLVLDAIAGKDISEDDDVDKEIALWKQSLSDNNVDIQEKSDFVISDVYDRSIRQLFELYLKKHKQFEDLFSSVNVENYIQDSVKYAVDLDFFDAWSANVEAERIIGRVDELDELSKIRNVRSIRLILNFRGFKNNNKNVFDEYSEIKIVFDQYKYTVADEKGHFNDMYERFYSQSYSENEVTQIVNQKTKTFLEKLKSRIV